MKKLTRNILIAAGAFAVAAVGTTLAVSRVLVDVAVKRKVVKLPDSMQNKLTGGLKDDPHSRLMLDAGESAQNLNTETVQIRSHDGLNLTGHIYGAQKPKRLVIAMHGWRSSWQVDYGCSVNFYHDNDCTMLYADQRGQNDSDGEYIGFGVLERHDCLSWINYAVERYGTDIPIYLLGVSMGAATVLMTSGFTLPQSVKGIIADCAFTSPQGIWEHIINNNLRLSSRLTYPIANAICKREAQFDGAEYSTIMALETNTVPVLFIHGSDDKFVPIDMTFENYKACNAPKQLLIVPGAGHAMSYVTDTKAYTRALLKFFYKCENNGFDEA
ncbi:MAG: alpha/beta hydrolase [Clostridia bacterium]|nr:alpha/beta hydrolase [Clostridia bacterium]